MVDGEWLEGCKTDKDFGGDKFPKTCEVNKRFLERVHPSVQKLLDQSGYGNHPDVFNFISMLAAKSESDSLVNGKQAVEQDNRTTHQKIADEYNKKMGVTK